MRLLVISLPLLLLAFPALGAPTAAEAQLVEANKRIEHLQKRLDDAIRRIETLERNTATPTVSIDGAVANNVMRQCTCKETDACDKELRDTRVLDTCMNSCSDHIKSFGNKTDGYLKCFIKYDAIIIEAENCLFGDLEMCNAYAEPKFIEATNWGELTNFTYAADAERSIQYNPFWMAHEPKYTQIQQFLTCTKNCIHKRLGECTAKKGCALNLPSPMKFERKMKECTKKNRQITEALESTCHCLALGYGVKDLKRACRFFGDQYYIDRA